MSWARRVETKVEIAFTTPPDDPAPAWVDVTADVHLPSGVSWSLGRGDEFEGPQPGECSLTLVDRGDGRYTPGDTGGAHYPDVTIGRMLRVSQRTLPAGSWIPQWTGGTTSWVPSWPRGDATLGLVQVRGSTRLSRLGRGAELPDLLAAEYRASGADLRAHYPLGEPEGSVSAGDATGTPHPLLTFAGTGAAPVFGSATGPPTDDLTACTFAGGRYLRGSMYEPAVSSGDVSWTVSAWFSTSSTAARQTVLGLDADAVLYVAQTTGVLSWEHTWEHVDGTTRFVLVSSAGSVADGATHHVAVRESRSGGDVTTTLFLDGAAVDSDVQAGSGHDNFGVLTVGGPAFAGVVSQVAVLAGATAVTDAEVADWAEAGATGFAGEPPGSRVERLARYAGVPVAQVDAEPGVMAALIHRDTTGRTPVDLMGEVAASEAGHLFDGKDGRLVFHGRDHRYNAVSAATVRPAVDASPALDDFGMVNEVLATRPEGPTVRAADAESVAEHGLYRRDMELITSSDAEVEAAAWWTVNRLSKPRLRVGSLDVQLAGQSDAAVAAVLAVEPGDLITVEGLPVGGPAFFVEGWSCEITDRGQTWRPNLTPGDGFQVWVLDDPALGVLDETTRVGF